jgi:hypothetical protein
MEIEGMAPGACCDLEKHAWTSVLHEKPHGGGAQGTLGA